MGGKGVSQGMTAHRFVDVSRFGGSSDRFLQATLIEVVAADDAATWVSGEFGGRKDVLPAPFLF